jgi:hypothetical protein
MTTEHSPAGVSALAPRDQEAIARTLTSLLAGFSERNAGALKAPPQSRSAFSRMRSS